MTSGLPFAATLLVLAGAGVALLGLGFWMAETSPGAEKGHRKRLGDAWRRLAGAPAGAVPGCLAAWTAARLAGLIRDGFTEADRRVAFGGLMYVLLLVFVPLAAAVNALIGGNPYLFWYYLTLLAALAVLNFTGETGRLRPVNALAATYLGVSLMVVIPVYVVRSFTDHTLNTVFNHAVLQSFLVAVFWYAAAYGAGLALDAAMRFLGRDPGRSAAARFVNGFLAALPAGYVLVFLALMAGHLAVGVQIPHRSWALVLAGAGFAALAVPVTLALMQWAAARGRDLALAAAYGLGIAAASALSMAAGAGIRIGAGEGISWAASLNLLMGLTADGARVYLGPDFWVAHLPFLPIIGFATAAVAGLVSKGMVAAVEARAGAGAAGAQPYLVSALSCAGMTALLWGGAALV